MKIITALYLNYVNRKHYIAQSNVNAKSIQNRTIGVKPRKEAILPAKKLT